MKGSPARPGCCGPLQRLTSAAALMLVLTGCAGRHSPADARRQVSLAPAERDAVLAEMRMMLGSVHGVLHGLGANDHQAIETAARASGMAAAVDAVLEQKLPPQFVELGMATHRKFDQLADLARTRAPADQLVRSLADTTTSCVACHAMYRF